jgi:hypothetical protein
MTLHCSSQEYEYYLAVLLSAGWLKPKTKRIFSSSVGKYDNEPKTNLKQFDVLF